MGLPLKKLPKKGLGQLSLVHTPGGKHLVVVVFSDQKHFLVYSTQKLAISKHTFYILSMGSLFFLKY